MNEDGSEFLKCDAPGCDHFEMTPVTIDAVNKPCPKCGANLCTEQDFIDYRAFVAGHQARNEIIRKENPDAPSVMVAHNVHAGKIHFSRAPVQGGNPFPNGSDRA